MKLPLCRLRALCLTDHRRETFETFAQARRVDVADIEPQVPVVLVRRGKKSLTGHEHHVLRQRWSQ